MSFPAPVPRAKLFTGRRGLMLASILIVNFVVWLDSAKFSLLNPFWSTDLHLSPSQISSVTASYLLGYFPLLLLAGILADRLGAKQMLIICISGVTVLSATMAFVHTYNEMWWRNLIFGVFFGFSWAPSQRLLSVWFPGALGARATSTWMSSTLIAGVLAPAIALPLANHLSWRDAFIVVAALGVPALVMLVLFTANKPEKLRGITAGEIARIQAEHRGVEVREKLSFRELLRALKNRSILTMIIATALATTPTWLSGPWLPYGLITLDKVNPDTVAWVSPLIAVIPVLFGLVNGTLVSRFFGGRTRPWLILGPACGAVGFLMGVLLHDSTWVLWGFFIGAFAFLCDPMFWGTVNSYWAGISRPEVTGTLNGASAAMQVAVGWVITDQSGKWIDTSVAGRGQLDTIWLVGAILFAVAIIPVLLSKEVRVHQAVAGKLEPTLPARTTDPVS
ncbi:MFS transporter [Amycolatopsis sp. FDAARGOS 1241]|uniref:MFS transporter n=1 Tax=Amycolatopsis sp. FDAARGOS 1241 TaxID=2778070 RepID=UPI001951414C|nr:MFS transporter [Amycolatopsis sp. FDAARGOS 1241]QRP46414.1 MFS transporter [Amycolatopsis sp. FDAARGOS 1241]